MDITVKEKDTGDLYLTPLLQQTAFWSDVKSDLGYRPRAFDIRVRGKDIRKGEHGSYFLVDDILVLEKCISDAAVIAYVPYGPLLTPDDELMGAFIEELSEALREKLDDDAILIRYDLPWFRDGDISPESMEIMLNWGTVSHNIRAAASGMLPVNTTFVSLREEIFARMKRKIRYNTGPAARHGVKIRVGSSADLGIFLSLYEETAMMMAKEKGALEYDLFGLDPKGEEHHPLSGLSRFKLGFGGERPDRMGCWDYPLKKDMAKLFAQEERRMPAYHL